MRWSYGYLCKCNRSGLVSLKFPFAYSGWHYRCSVTLATQQWMRVLMGARPFLRNACHRTMIMPVNPPRLRLIHISPSYQTVYRSFEIILEWVLSIAVVLKLFLIAYHLCVRYCHHVPPCSRKSQCAKYHSIKSLENQNWHKCNVNKMAVRNFNGHI